MPRLEWMNIDEGKTQRYGKWVKAIEAWGKKHGITLKQAISIFTEYDPDHGYRSLFWAESDDFSMQLAAEQGLPGFKLPEQKA